MRSTGRQFRCAPLPPVNSAVDMTSVVGVVLHHQDCYRGVP